MTIRTFYWSIVLCVVATCVLAQQGTTQRVRFARGETSATVEGAVVRGTRDRYLIQARRGQMITVRLSSLESNAVFDLYAPGGKPRLNTMDDTTIWGGKLPASGDYTISVGPTRGNATYTLEVTVEK